MKRLVLFSIILFMLTISAKLTAQEHKNINSQIFVEEFLKNNLGIKQTVAESKKFKLLKETMLGQYDYTLEVNSQLYKTKSPL